MKQTSDTPGQLERIYSNRFEGQNEYRTRVWKILVSQFFSRYVASDAAVLDLGSGQGLFINNIRCREKFAMDLNPGARQALDSDVTFFEQDCSQRWDLGNESLDLVFSSNFFEHMASKQALSDTIGEAKRCMRPGASFITMGPNIRFVGGAYWDFWDHHLPLTELSMAELLEMHGFHIEKATDRFLPYTMTNMRPIPGALIALYLKMPVVWRLFGKQFLVIARKP